MAFTLPRERHITPTSRELHERRDEILAFLEDHGIEPGQTCEVEFDNEAMVVHRFHRNDDGLHMSGHCSGESTQQATRWFTVDGLIEVETYCEGCGAVYGRQSLIGSAVNGIDPPEWPEPHGVCRVVPEWVPYKQKVVA